MTFFMNISIWISFAPEQTFLLPYLCKAAIQLKMIFESNFQFLIRTGHQSLTQGLLLD